MPSSAAAEDEPTAPVADEPRAADEPTASLTGGPHATGQPAAGLPPAWTPPDPSAAAAGDTPPPPPPGASSPPPPGGGGQVPPPWFGTAGEGGPTFSRERLIRPTRGRYVAGVCAAIGRATNTDPVLWRVLLVVLGLFGGVGILIYLIGWLGIPGEGDSVSPIESLLGRGSSRMGPLSVVLLGAAAALTFAFIVQDGFRATLLGGAALAGVALLIKRNSGNSRSVPAAPPAGGTFASGPGTPAADEPTVAFATGAATSAPAPGAPVPAGEPVSSPTAPAASGPGYPPPQFTPPTGGYRPPFAPHGPYAGLPPYENQAPKPPKPKKPPRERSKLGRITFFAVLMVMGLLAVIDLAGATLPVSAYFAAALATIALGLIVGAWFGRARGLIALALAATLGLAISSGVELWGGQVIDSNYRPQSIAQVANRYDFRVGNATLDLRAVNFTGAQQDTTVTMRLGQVRVLLPANVDTTAAVDMHSGRAMIFGREWDSRDVRSQEVTDQGPDGPGGGTLRLNIQMNTGNVEVSR